MTETYYGLFSCSLVFSTYREYKQKRAIIRKTYDTFTTQQKVIYRMYVFSRPLLKDKQMEYIWGDLNRNFML